MATAILTQIAIVPFYIRSFNAYQFGVLMILLSIVSFAGIGIGWMSGGALRLLGECSGRQDDTAFRRTFGLSRTIYVGYSLCICLLLCIAALFFSPWIFTKAAPEDLPVVKQALFFTGVYLVPFYLASIERMALTARKLQSHANITQIIGMLAFASCTVAWLSFGGGMQGVLLCQIVGALVSYFLAHKKMLQEIGSAGIDLPSKTNADLLKKLGGKTGIGFFLQGMMILVLLADTAIVGWLGGAAVAATFYLVWKMAEVLVQLIWKFSESMSPYFIHMDVRGDHDRMRRICLRAYVAIGGLALCAGLGYALLGHFAVALWVGADKAPDDFLAYALAGGAVFWMGLARLPVILAGAKLALKPLNQVMAIELGAKLVLAFVLFPRFNYLAILIATNITHAFGAAWLYLRLLRISLEFNSEVG